jgi:hypothetical protein
MHGIAFVQRSPADLGIELDALRVVGGEAKSDEKIVRKTSYWFRDARPCAAWTR